MTPHSARGVTAAAEGLEAGAQLSSPAVLLPLDGPSPAALGVFLRRDGRSVGGSFMRTACIAVLALSFASLSACGPSFPFSPSNIDREPLTSPGEDIVFDAEHCGPRAEIDTVGMEINCFEPGGFSPSFTYQLRRVAQADGPELVLLYARNLGVGGGDRTR